MTSTDKAPERVWAWGIPVPVYCSSVDPKPNRDATEYVRLDLYNAANKQRDDAQTEIARLTAELRDVEYQRDQYHEAAHRHRGEVQRLLHDAIEPLKAERDTALARAAAAAGDMQEKALEEAHKGRVRGYRHDLTYEAIRALPIPTDAQETLDKMLSQARLEGWRAGRDAAARTCVLSGQDLAEGDWGPEGRAMAVMLEGNIRDLPITPRPDREGRT